MVALQMMLASGSSTPVAMWHAALNAFGGAFFFFTMVSGDDVARAAGRRPGVTTSCEAGGMNLVPASPS